MSTSTRRLLSLTDVSLLARVERPVPTLWRTRYAARRRPFPAPAHTNDGREFFDCDEVVNWLEETERGNNRTARQDAVAFTVPSAEVVGDDVTFAGLTSLICLRAATGPLPVDTDELLDRADSFDSDDDLIFAEIEALGDRLDPLARYAELLVSAAFGPADPFDELVRRRHDTARERPLDPNLRRLVAATLLAVADHAGFTTPTFVVGTVRDVELVVTTARLAEERGTVGAALTVTARSQPADLRLARRWLHVHGLRASEILGDEDGAYTLPDQSILALRLATTDADRLADLDAISNLCLNLSAANRAVVVGPSATLTDPLLAPRGRGRPRADTDPKPSRAGLVRQDALRTGAVRAVVRLPAGLLREQSRARSALWLLGPDPGPVPMTLTADVTGRLDDRSADDLVTDLTVAMAGPDGEVAHELNAATFVRTLDLATTTDALVTAQAGPVAVGAAATMSTLDAVAARLAAPIPGVALPPRRVNETALRASRITLQEAVRRGRLSLMPGARIESTATAPGRALPVVRHADDVDRRDQLPGLSAAQLALDYPQVGLTEPGDIVLTTTAGHRAVVDPIGGLVVAYPARVLRCHRPRTTTAEERESFRRHGEYPAELEPQSFVAEVVAAEINALPAEAADWKAWPLTLLPVDQVPAVEVALGDLALRRTRLQSALSDVDHAISTLTRAVGARLCTLPRADTAPPTLMITK